MSAIPAGRPAPKRDTAPKLALVAPQPQSKLGALPFFVLVAGVLAIGMVGVLLLNITIQSQAGELRALQRHAEELDYRRAVLQGEVEQLRSSSNIAARASALGMRPNPHPAFILLPSGEIVGTPTAVSGQELSPLVAAGRGERAAQSSIAAVPAAVDAPEQLAVEPAVAAAGQPAGEGSGVAEQPEQAAAAPAPAEGEGP